MTSCCHGAKIFCSKQSVTQRKMASLSIVSLNLFFGEEPKSIKRGENHYKSGHIESFVYDNGAIRGEVRASMKNKTWKVTVSSRRFVDDLST